MRALGFDRRPRAVWGVGGITSPERWGLAWDARVHPQRRAAPAGTLLVCGLNPSTAWAHGGHGELDPTLTRIDDFARGLGVAAVAMINLYAERETHPRLLWPRLSAQDPNRVREGLWCAIAQLGLPTPIRFVAAWGVTRPPKGSVWTLEDHQRRQRLVCDLVRAWSGDGTVWCWGRTVCGEPRHPLYLPGDAELVPWEAP